MTTIRRPLALAAVFPIVALASGCGGNQTTASKSAAEFDEAQKKGVQPGTGEAHGAHGQAAEGQRSPAPSNMTGMDHSSMPGMGSAPASRPGAKAADSSMAGMDHSHMPGMGGAPAARPGAKGTGSSMAGMDHASVPGMDHARTPSMDHAKMGHSPAMSQPAPVPPPPVPEQPVAVAEPGQPAATLRPDEIDSPALTAVREAARAAEMAMQMAGGGHGMQHGTYRQIDAGRDDATPPREEGHEGHQVAPSPRPTPSPRPKEDNR